MKNLKLIVKLLGGKLLLLSIPFIVLSFSLDPAFSQLRTNQNAPVEQQIKAAENLIKVNALPQAQLELEKALRIYRSNSDLPGSRLVLIRLSQVSYQQGDYQQAQQYLGQAQRIPGNQQAGEILSMEGLIQLEMGEYAQALQSLRAAQGRQTPNIAVEIRNRIGLAEALHGTGAYTQALALLQVAIRSPGDRFDQAKSLNAIADLYFSLGQYEQAETSYQQALQIRKSIGDSRGVGRTLRNLGRVNLALKKYSIGAKFYEEALQQSSARQDFIGQVKLLNDLAVLAIARNNFSAAEQYLQEAIANSRLSNGAGQGQTLTNLGYLYLSQNQFELAIENFEAAVAYARKQSDRNTEVIALSGLGEAKLGLGQSGQAVKILELGIERFESFRPGLRDQDKVSLFDTYSHSYRLLQRALVLQNQTEQALVIAERGRARAFSELLAQRQLTKQSINSQPPSIAQIQSIAKQSQSTIVTYSVIYGSDRRESALYIWLIKPNGEINFKQVELQKQIQTSLSNVAKQSRSGAAIGEDSVELTNFVTAVRGNLTAPSKSRSSSPNSGSSSQNSALLSLQNAYQLLIQPIASLLPSDPEARVIFVPQDALFLVPFAALQDPNGKFLLEKHTMQISPSIQSLLLINSTPPKTKSALIVGNPSPMPLQLEPLVGSEIEAKGIAKILQTEAIIGRNANKSNVLAKIKQASVIHFATHGLLNDREALQSGLALSTSEGDGLLTAAEIFDLKLQAELAILSACNTGRGKITGDGVIGLSRSLISAGVSNLIVSLWAVPDQPTAELMTEFYRNWQKSPNKPQALRKAMLVTMQKYPNPRDWASFVLIGK